ncbi:MAG: exodeoxyribonuclease III [Myxococcales bacterium]|nr:exodeoxyribonuclease III [Myxococcales bacterium]
MRIVSWNVNGLRSALKKGFLDYLSTDSPDILGLQEVRALPDQLPTDIVDPSGYHAFYQPAEKKGYSGVALFCREKPKHTWTDLGVSEFDREGRIIAAEFDDFVILNIYFPNGSGNRDNSRVPFKLAFYKAVFERIAEIRRSGLEVIVMGDFNTAHRPIDLARPQANRNNSGFLMEECDAFQDWLDAGLVDTFRHIHKDEPDRYTWWTFRAGARARNVGWRIDYVLATPGLAGRIEDADIHDQIHGSDHCPISLTLTES